MTPGPDRAGARPAARVRLDLDVSAVEVARRLRHRERLVVLTGAWHHGDALLAADPDHVLPTDADPFDLDIAPAPADGTFGGGWLGIWGYRLGRRIESLGAEPRRPHGQPDHVLAHYRHVLRLSNGVWWAESLGTDAELRAWLVELDADLGEPAVAGTHRFEPFASTPEPGAHEAAVSRTLEHIAAGDIFQANVCLRLDSTFTGDPLEAFCAGVEALAPAYAAYVAWPDGAVANFSPELFLRRTGHEVLASPIKGTAPLSTDPTVLTASAKDRAENVMIVDLMRNDLGRVCEPGSVRVPSVARLERHSVWHLVSDVVGRLRSNLTDADLLRATFPPGSVTGAPKVRAMQITGELESTAREAYTGAIGHLSPHAGLELNVAIRTVEFARLGPERWAAWLGVGGGIVADSAPAAELEECFTKAAPLVAALGADLTDQPKSTRERSRTHSRAVHNPLASGPELTRERRDVFETVLVVDGVPVDLDAHLARLDASLRALHGSTVRAGLEGAVRRHVRDLVGRHRLRIDAVAAPEGHVDVSLAVAPLVDEPVPWRLDVTVLPGGLGAHKWADRSPLGPHVPGRDHLIVDVDGSVLEAGRASVFIVRDDGVHTPALDGRLLPGTERARVIERLRAHGIGVHQHRLTTDDLGEATEVFVTNALRGVVPVTEIPGVGAWSPGAVATLLRDGPPVRGPAAAPRRGDARVLFIDNHDSFVYNLVQYVGELGATAEVVRNDHREVDALVARTAAGEFTHLIISPGPGTPAEAGISAQLIEQLGATTPTLGVCLGHQVIGELFGGRVVRARQLVHGKPSLVHHDGTGLFAGLPSPLTCARYHSLVIDPTSLPDCLETTARTASGVIMGVRHRELPIEGVQMHPESILTHRGHDMIATFLDR